MKLTPGVLSSRYPDTALSELVSADCSNMDITHIEDLSVAVNLHKLNLSKNGIKKADALSGIRHNKELTLLNLSGNALDSLQGVETLHKLLVLNMSHNEVNRISQHVANCRALKALILNHNKIARIENLINLTQLNTLVLSHNTLTTLEGLGSLPNLTKLSVAHNQIRIFPDLRLLPALKELRLNDNKIITIPDHIRFLPALELLDMGNNLMRSVADIASLASLHTLINLNLKGNPLVEKEKEKGREDKEDKYRQTVLTLCPTLRVLDTHRFDPKFLERKMKRQATLQKKKRKDTTGNNGIDESQLGTSAGPQKRRRTDEKSGDGDKGDERKEMHKPKKTKGEPTDEMRNKRKREHNTNEAVTKSTRERDVKRQKERATAEGNVNNAEIRGSAPHRVEKRTGNSAQTNKRDKGVIKKRNVERNKAQLDNMADESDPFFLTGESDGPSSKEKKGRLKKPRATTEPRSSTAPDGKAHENKSGKQKNKSNDSQSKQPKREPKQENQKNDKPAGQSKASIQNGQGSVLPKSSIMQVEEKGRKDSTGIQKQGGLSTAAKESSNNANALSNSRGPPIEASKAARSGVVAVVDVKARVPKEKKIIAPFEPVEANSAANEPTGLLVGGWD